MLYLISAVIAFIIFASGFAVVRLHPALVDKVVTKIVFVGFVFQIIANWLFWGGADTSFAVQATVDKASVNFLFLCLVSIFAYAGMLAVLFKAHDFYNGD